MWKTFLLDKRRKTVYTVHKAYIQYVQIKGGDCVKIIIRNTAGLPIYEQIKEQIKTAIFVGDLKEGEALPSIRQLARDLKISVITTTRAYNDLEQEGFLASVQGKGFFVLPQNSQLLREQSLRELEEHITAAIAAAKKAGMTKEEVFDLIEVMLQEEAYE
jgi:GntR family transcriptional regulator